MQLCDIQGPVRLRKPFRARARERGAAETVDAMVTVSASEMAVLCRLMFAYVRGMSLRTKGLRRITNPRKSPSPDVYVVTARDMGPLASSIA